MTIPFMIVVSTVRVPIALPMTISARITMTLTAAVTVSITTGGVVVSRRVMPPLPAEWRPGLPDLLGLDAQAAVSGGRRLLGPQDVEPVLEALSRDAGRPLAPWLLLAALLLSVLDAAAWAGLRWPIPGRPRPSPLRGVDGSG